MLHILVLILLSLTQLYAIHLYVLTTDDTLGKLIIENGDYVILRPHHPISINAPLNIRIIECNTIKCKDHEIKRIEHKYRSSKLKANVIN